MSLDLTNKLVFITGASSGIGLACAEQFARLKAKLLLCARREDRLARAALDLQKRYQVPVYHFGLDVRQFGQVEKQWQNLPPEWQDVDILVNNAGLALGFDKIQTGELTDWDRMIDTNIKGVLHVTRTVLPFMLKRNQGHIINIGSISAHEVYSGGVVYCATKFALKAISQGLKMDVHGTPIRVSSIDPGMVKTEFSDVRFGGDPERANAVYQGVTPLNPEDVAEAVVFCATRPSHVDVREIKIYPTDQTASFMVSRK